MFLWIAQCLFEKVFYGSVTISLIQPALMEIKMFNCSMEMIHGLFFNYMSVQAFGMHRVYKQQNVSRKKLVDTVFSSTSKNIGQIVGHFMKISYRNPKKTRIPVAGPSFCRIHSVTSSYRESCRLLFGWHLLINFEDQTRTEKTATNAWWFQVGDLLVICPQRKHHQAGETNHLNHWHFGSSLSQSNKSSWWVGASENKY